MPLTSKGRKILGNMEREYGDKKGKSVFYASKNEGRISGVDADPGSEIARAVTSLPAKSVQGAKQMYQNTSSTISDRQHFIRGIRDAARAGLTADAALRRTIDAMRQKKIRAHFRDRIIKSTHDGMAPSLAIRDALGMPRR